MTRDEIYDHLAQVYIGKKSKTGQEQKNKFNAWLLINIVTTVVIFASAFYGFTAFLTHRNEALQKKIIYALNNGPIRIGYDLNYPYPSVKTFALSTPQINAAKYKTIRFSIRGLEEGYPNIIRVELRNKKNEVSSVLVQGVRLGWKSCVIPFEDFKEITDWSNIEDVSFILEAWNAEKKKGIILIDDISFSS
jgi:hypothetical protein